ncbi:hypothetical protein [Ruminococcus callidus]|uniref:hypothetical protein n=1 Tax=Ruminococcus callidus TaxID=40519 RepID=UPI003520FBE2
MKKQIATLLALSTAAACILTYQPTAVGAEEYSVLDNTDKLVQEALDDNTDELGDALYDSVTEGDVPLYEADASSTQSELEKAAIEKGMYKDTFSFANHLCTLSQEDFAKRVYEPVRANMTDSEIDLGYEADISRVAYKGGLCFGMTAISVLVHNGELTPGDLQEGAETLYDVTLTDDVDALIAYYNSLQLYTEVELAVITAPAMLTKEEHTDMFLDCAARCKEKGTYFMACISSAKSGTHAMVGMDEQFGNWTFNGISYDTCILTYDSNSVQKDTKESIFSDKTCIYINSETKQYCVPAYDLTSENGGVLLDASDDDSLLTYRAPIRGTTEVNTDVSETVKWRFFSGTTKDQIDVTSTTKDGTSYDFWKACKMNYGDTIYFGKGSTFHLEKKERAQGFAFDVNGIGYRLRMEQYAESSPETPKVHDRGTKCKMDFCGDSISYTNTDTESILVSYILTYDQGTYNYEPVGSVHIALVIYPNQTATISKQDTGLAITGDGEIFVQALPMATQKCIDEFDGTWEEFLNWFGSYFFNFVRSKDALLQFNTKDECSELLYDFDGDGVYDDAPILGDADGDGVPYQPGDIYQILWHINDIATSEHGVRRYNRGYVPNSEGDTDGNGVIDTCDLFDIVYECALRGAGLK